MLFLPVLFAELNNSWDQTLFDKGTPKIFNTHFFDLSVVNPLFEYLDEGGHTMEPYLPYRMGGGSFLANFEKEGSKGIFEWGYWADIYVPADGQEWTIDGFYDMKFEYDLTTGVLNGYHILMDYNGTTEDGKILDLFLHQHVEAVGYRMEKLHWGQGVPGFEFLIAIPTLITISAISHYINKKRKSKT